MEIEIRKEQQNLLLKRKEITFEVDHSKSKGTPQRLEIRNELAQILRTEPELVYIKRVKTKTGIMKATGEANAYESIKQAKLIEPIHIINRNTLQEKKETPEEKVEGEALQQKKTK